MLRITIPAREFWDESKEEFIYTEAVTLEFEHSLVSLSKWESKWCKPFLTKNEKTYEEVIDYIKCMTITPNVSPEIYNLLTDENLEEINNYIEAPMTATTFSNENRGKPSREQITSELIYYWMIASNVPFECQYWHLNRLITLIRVCGVKNQLRKKRANREILSDYAALNAERRKKLNSKG